ncbi:putative DNA-binding domain-containing protein [Variovorax sp. HJSM1_2]|uniref:HvfC/BufC family peptide modification chaperone n=1 Tax=Variovorax sp. HJSM1_2 TaxID=3366263 RepID=UPI003BCBC694
MNSFQQSFAQALRQNAAGPIGSANAAGNSAINALLQQPAFAVYRNTVRKGCIDALEANYPSVVRLVGSEWFRSVAAFVVAAAPPQDSRLLDYGQGLADFLAAFEPAATLPYLPGVARLDRFWTEAHTAADALALDGSALASLAPEALAGLALRPHPAARWLWFDDMPVYTIWQRNRDANPDNSDIPWQSEGALITRPADKVWCSPLSNAGTAFLDACAQGCSLGEAAAAALAQDPQADLTALLAHLLRSGALSTP